MTASAHQRKVAVILLGTCLLVLFLVLASMNAFKNFLNPATTEQIVVFTGLSAMAFVLFVGVLVLLVRNVLKLYADQSSRVMGKRLRTRMLWGAVLVSLIPIAFMFAFSYDLMNRAVDRWFSQPVTQMRDDSNRMALELAQYTAANARVEADSIATSLPALKLMGTKGQKVGTAGISPDTLSDILQVLRHHEGTLQGGFVVVYHDGQAIAAFHLPEQPGTTARLKPWLPEHSDTSDENDIAPKPDVADASNAATLELSTAKDAAILTAAQRSDEPMFSLGKTDYALGASVLNTGGSVVVGLPMPYGMSDTMTRLRKAADDYWKLFRSRRLIRNTYMWLLLMMTSLALFATSWLALHLSKQVTRPVEALADAMEAIAAGDYAHRVGESATEELEELVRSFNHMAADLEGSRHAVEESTIQLSRANAALEARRGELETMLQTIPNGVATLDVSRNVVLANRALSEMMDPGGQRPFLGMPMEEVFPAEVTEALDRLMKRSHRMGSASGEMEMSKPNGNGTGVLNLLATVALLETGERVHLGYVVVLENATELLQAQKQSAWKEVARRVAHEIKNPLTPISLSAEQIHRHIGRMEDVMVADGTTSTSIAVIRRCSEVITSSVESMRSLVDQFAALAEFPTARPRPADLNTIVENSLAMFAGRLQNLRLVKKFDPALPLVMADPEALKRALGNLIDNAAEAMQQSLLRELRITTSLLDSGMVELTIADTGSGLTDEMRERLFLPYFSTKQRGTGLGLAIAGKIIQEHEGTIRAEKNVPAGAKFILELRTASLADTTESQPALTVGSTL
ncbi:sensor histidine kinase [Granulicella arctica]|uniref:sensor histidine kinase n=1 Tax=Granulicella arctica TaxID=940613 RepID=UPI0021DF528A|nr:ATP-binding protein [Granulicella arctica]